MSNSEWKKAYEVAQKLFGRNQVSMKIVPHGTQEKRKMKFPAKSGSDFTPVPAGNHVGICNAVIDLGLQPGSDRYPKPKHQVYIRFELPTEQITYEKDGEELSGPMSIGRIFTASMHENANLRAFIEGWFAKRFPSDAAAEDFEFAKLAGYKCLLNVTHNERDGKTYANISNATPLPKEMKADYDQHNPSLIYDLSEPDQAVFDALPEWLQKKINGRLDDKPDTELNPEGVFEEVFDDDIPF